MPGVGENHLPQGLDRSTRQQPPKQRSQVGVIISSALYVRANLYIRFEGIRTITENNNPTIQWNPRLLTGVRQHLSFVGLLAFRSHFDLYCNRRVLEAFQVQMAPAQRPSKSVTRVKRGSGERGAGSPHIQPR